MLRLKHIVKLFRDLAMFSIVNRSVLLLFLVLQRYYLQGLLAGSVKG